MPYCRDTFGTALAICSVLMTERDSTQAFSASFLPAESAPGSSQESPAELGWPMQTTETAQTTDVARAVLRASSDSRVLICDGYGVKIVCRRGQLVLTDGIRTGSRTRIVGRTDGVRRLVILAEDGFISFDALRWLESEGIGVLVLERDGRITVSTSSRFHAPEIVRSQGIMSASGLPRERLEIVRSILAAKLEGQARVSRELLRRPDAADEIDEVIRHLSKAEFMRELTGFEGRAATSYWNAWHDVSVPFPPDRLSYLPPHWYGNFPGRSSGTTATDIASRRRKQKTGDEASASSNRGATDVCNAVLNYIYRVAESEAKIACLVHGLDPGIGIMHRIESDRDSMALDLLEVARPVCDAIALELFDTGYGVPYDPAGKPSYFDPSWVYEIRHGVVRLSQPLTGMLAERCLDIARVIEPFAARIAAELSAAHTPDMSPKPTPSLERSGRAIATRSVLQRMPVPADASEVIPDQAWQKISRHIPVVANLRGSRRADDRLVLAAMIWTSANGLPWSRIPPSLPVQAHTLERRRKEWRATGHYPRIIRAVRSTVLSGFTG